MNKFTLSRVVVFEWIATILSLIGAYMVAQNNQVASGYGFCFFLASNLFWFLYAYRKGATGLFVAQIGFTYTSILGILHYFF